MVAQVWGQFNNPYAFNPYANFGCIYPFMQFNNYAFNAFSNYSYIPFNNLYTTCNYTHPLQFNFYQQQTPQFNMWQQNKFGYYYAPQSNIDFFTSNKTSKQDTFAPASRETSREQTLTPEVVRQLINGTYSAPYVKINGVTHYRYSDCKASDLVQVSNAANGKLHKDAASAFKKMQKAAMAEGINLSVVSGFRSTTYQKQPFSKHGTSVDAIKNRVKLSAPPGFSEHHTGYAMDINSTEQSFENTQAYAWLKRNAHKYGFEQSFTRGNDQGVAYEPWHWRFVGTEDARETFEAARA